MEDELDKEGVANEEEVNPGVLASKNLDLDSMESVDASSPSILSSPLLSSPRLASRLPCFLSSLLFFSQLEPSRVDERFEAIYTDPDFRVRRSSSRELLGMTAGLIAGPAG